MSAFYRASVIAGLLSVCIATTASAATVTLNQLNNNFTALITANDGAGDTLTNSGMEAAQFNVTLDPDMGSPTTFDTFCIDLFHNSVVGQTYDVTERTDLATAFANGSRIAMIYDADGIQDLTNNTDQAAAVQLALWDLSLNNHDPVSFGVDGDGTYSSGDESIFSVNFGSNPDASAIAALTNSYLVGSIGATTPGAWIDAAASGDATDRGQSLLVPPGVGTSFPEPTAVGMLVVGGAGLLARRRKA